MGMKLAATVFLLAAVMAIESGCGSPTCRDTGGRFACDPTAAPLGSDRPVGSDQEA